MVKLPTILGCKRSFKVGSMSLNTSDDGVKKSTISIPASAKATDDAIVARLSAFLLSSKTVM